MSPIGKPFVDSGGKRGRPRLTTSRDITSSKKPENKIRFELHSEKYLRLTLPERKPIMITKRNAIALAHWLLDVTSRP